MDLRNDLSAVFQSDIEEQSLRLQLARYVPKENGVDVMDGIVADIIPTLDSDLLSWLDGYTDSDTNRKVSFDVLHCASKYVYGPQISFSE